MKAVKMPIAQTSPLSRRLSRLARLNAAELEALATAESDLRRSPARREMLTEGTPIRAPRAILSGWAYRQRILPDGQRQILGVLIPGDLIGMCQHRAPLSSTTIAAVTEVTTCAVPAAEPGSGLAEGYARSAALETHHFLAQITRLGRLNAYERLADWFLETQERLALVDMSIAGQFALPLTQEMLADTLGLTSVHVNRTLQTLRRDGLLTLQGGMAAFPDQARLSQLFHYKAARVSSDD